MKYITFLVGFLFLLSLSSCDIDGFLDANTGSDNDDVNVIDLVGEQSLDTAINMRYHTRTRAS
ncbi:MAG: hypothetical protein H6767_02240 [Candidatus Peribacteria bacterium]|nr:MAG: hypothetical protein H6767_02240 [Candidatus Peribacteria bacterium]